MNIPLLDAELIEDAISRYSVDGKARSFRIQTVAETGSTNDDAFDAAFRKHASDGLVIIADQQVSGRGRRGDAWVAPAGASILLSILLRPQPDFEPALWPRLPHLAGIALARAIERAVPTLTDPVQVKWPNDVYLAGKKVAGILVESQIGNPARQPTIVVGIGLNVNTAIEEFPAELRETATSLREHTTDPTTPLDRNLIAGAILAEWAAHFPSEMRSPQFTTIVEALSRRSILLGQQVELTQNDESLAGVVTGFGDDGELLLIPEGEGESRPIFTADYIRLV